MTALVLRRRFVLLTFLRWFPTGLIIPVLVLLLVGRGLSLPTVGAVLAAYGVTCAVLELPTGGLADVIGRRRVLLASLGTGTVAWLVLAFATTPVLLVTAALLAGVARALDTGPLEAWYVDTLHGLDPGADLKPGLARAASASAVGLALGSLAGGGIALVSPLPATGDGLLLSLSVPYLVAAAFAVVQLVMLVRWMADPPRVSLPVRAVLAGVPATMRAGASVVATSGVLRRLSARTALIGLVLSSTEVLGPVQFSTGGPVGDSGDGVGAYAALITVAFLASALGARLGPGLARLARGTGRGVLLCSLAAAGAAAALAVPSWWGAAVAYVLLYCALGLDEPLVGELLHDQTAAGQRSTVLSVQSLVGQGGGTVGNLVVPAVAAAATFATAWFLLAAAMLIGAALSVGLPRGRRSGEVITDPPVVVS